MVAQVRLERLDVNEPVPDLTPSVVVAAVVRVESVPQAKPCWVALLSALVSIAPFNVPAVVERDEAADVVILGGGTYSYAPASGAEPWGIEVPA